MTTCAVLFKTRCCTTHTDYRLVECKHPLGTRSYQVVIAQRKYAPVIRVHSLLDAAIKDYIGTVAGECAELGTPELSDELADFPRYAAGADRFADALPSITPPVSPETFA